MYTRVYSCILVYKFEFSRVSVLKQPKIKKVGQVYTYTQVYTGIHRYTQVYTYTHIHIYTYIHIYIYAYIHTYSLFGRRTMYKVNLDTKCYSIGTRTFYSKLECIPFPFS